MFFFVMLASKLYFLWEFPSCKYCFLPDSAVAVTDCHTGDPGLNFSAQIAAALQKTFRYTDGYVGVSLQCSGTVGWATGWASGL